jgi:uncharacterized protein YbjT (DUF2867 family)
MAVLVVGATGFVGRPLVHALIEAGEDVVAASRRRPGDDLAGARWAFCDLAAPDTITPLLEGVSTAYYLVHSMGQRAENFRERDSRCAQHFIEAAERSACRRIVYLGGVEPRGRPSEHLASRLEVGEVLRRGSVPALELRAAMIVGNGSESWRIVRDLAARLPFMVLPRWLESKSCPIALFDVIAALLDARRVALDQSAWFDIPGPEQYSARELLEIVAGLDGRRIRAVRVPVLTPALSAMWLKLVSGANYPLARELVLGLTADLLPTRSFWDLSGHPPVWTFREAAARALATEAPPSRLARFVERAVHRIGPHIHGAAG